MPRCCKKLQVKNGKISHIRHSLHNNFFHNNYAIWTVMFSMLSLLVTRVNDYPKSLVKTRLQNYLKCVMFCSHHKSHLTSTDCISTDLISSALNGCEVTQFAVAATNHNRLTGWWPVFATSQGSLLDWLPAYTWAVRPNAFWLVAARAYDPICRGFDQSQHTQFRWNEVR